MKHPRRRLRVVSSLALLATIVAGHPDASAQAPVDGIHTTMGPGAGLTASISASGDYATAVPLDLPSPRGPLPVPVSVVHAGGPRAGVAGLGWDVPLSYVRVSRGAWQRKPAADGSPDERVVVVLDGASALMVPRGDHYVPFAAGAYQELRRDGTSWTLTTLANLEYTFRPAATVAAGEGMPDPDLWLLTQIRDRAGSDEVILEYAVDGVGSCGNELRLVAVRYTFDALSERRALYQVRLDHEPWWRPGEAEGACATHPTSPGQVARAFAHVQDDQLGFGRVRVLAHIRVLARDNLDALSSPREIRAYHFAYQPDLATEQPRLTDVTVTGEAGTALGDRPLPVASYGYGPTVEVVPATQTGHDAEPTTTKSIGLVSFGAPTQVAQLSGPGLTTTITSRQKVTQGILYADVGWRTKTKLRRLLRDFTGDGLPDLLERVGGESSWRWELRVNRLGPNGPDFSAPPLTWGAGQGPAELQMSTTLRFDDPPDTGAIGAAMVTTETWSQFTDWDGDGRVDVIDADGGDDEDHWRVWINRPAGDGITWRAVQVDVSAQRAWLAARGYQQVKEMDLDVHEQGDWSINLPIERSRTWC